MEKFNKQMDITFVDGQYIDVLKLVRDKVHQGFNIITHPLMGSIKPNETPYRSLIVEEGHQLDLQSLSIIESSIQVTEKFFKDRPMPQWSDNTIKDFQFVDSRLFESALDSING